MYKTVEVKMIQRFEVGSRFSEMAIHNGVAYLAGQVPLDDTADNTPKPSKCLQKLINGWQKPTAIKVKF